MKIPMRVKMASMDQEDVELESASRTSVMLVEDTDTQPGEWPRYHDPLAQTHRNV
jgi:hypothetical protein